MPRKRRTVNPDKVLKMWIAPEWSTRLHESHSSTVMGSAFSRYVALADKILEKDAKEAEARAEAEIRRAKSDDASVTIQAQLNGPDARELSSEALLALTAPKMALPKPPKRPASPKPRKVTMPKPRATPTLAKPRKVAYPRPRVLPR